MQETLDLISGGSEVLALGYGYSNYNMYSSPSPMKSKTNIRSQFIWQGAEEKGILQTKPYYKLGMIVQTNFPDNVYHGGGDSGSPLWASINNEWVYIGALSAAVGPTANLPNTDSIWKDKFWTDNAGGHYYTAWSFEFLIEDAKKFLLDTEKIKEEKINIPTVIQNPKPQVVVEVPTIPAVIVQKKITILCTKGKLKKKITSINPKCPTGYKKNSIGV